MRFYSYNIVETNEKNSHKKRKKSTTSKKPKGKETTTKQQREFIRKVETLDEDLDVCICHREYNHCVQNNINGEIPEILPSADLEGLNFTQNFVNSNIENLMMTTTTTTTRAPEVVEAMGYEANY